MTAAEPRTRVDRDEVFLEYTKSICPVCKAVVDAEVNIRDNKVFLRKRCREHGAFEALVYGDAEMYIGVAAVQQAGHDPARDPDRGPRRLPARLRALPGPQAARLPRAHRGQHGLQPRLPGLLRRLRPPRPTGSRSPASRWRPASTRSWPPKASPRWSCSPAASRRSTRRSSSSADGPATRASARSCSTPTASASPTTATFATALAEIGRADLPAVRRARRVHPPGDPGTRPAGGQGQGAGALRRRRPRRAAGRRGRAETQRGRGRRHRPLRHRPPGRARRGVPAGDPLPAARPRSTRCTGSPTPT